MIFILKEYSKQINYACTDYLTKLDSQNLKDAKQECQKNPTCHMFYDVCGRGDTFNLCKGTAEAVPSECGSILHTKGNLNKIRQF